MTWPNLLGDGSRAHWETGRSVTSGWIQLYWEDVFQEPHAIDMDTLSFSYFHVEELAHRKKHE